MNALTRYEKQLNHAYSKGLRAGRRRAACVVPYVKRDFANQWLIGYRAGVAMVDRVGEVAR